YVRRNPVATQVRVHGLVVEEGGCVPSTHPPNCRALDGEKPEETDAVDEQGEDRQLPRLHHGIAQIHNLELDRHTVPLVEFTWLAKNISLRGQTCSYARRCQ